MHLRGPGRVLGIQGYWQRDTGYFVNISRDAGYLDQGALAIRRIFSLVDRITKPKFSNCPNIFIIGLFRL